MKPQWLASYLHVVNMELSISRIERKKKERRKKELILVHGLKQHSTLYIIVT